jgi:hypothetical protein
MHSKREAFWRSTVSSQQKSPHTLWNTINNLLGRGRVPTQDAIGADVFHRFFDDKVEAVRASIAGTPAPTFSTTAASLPVFQPVSLIDVIDAIRRLPNKCCTSDPVPTYLLKAALSRVAAFLTELFN